MGWRWLLQAALAMSSVLAVTPHAAADVSGSPLTLGVQRGDGGVTLTLVGAASTKTEITYQLDVEGASTVHQRGQAVLMPDGNERLARVTINGRAPWHATLRVDSGGRRFVQRIDG